MVCLRGVPSPWSQAALALLNHKGIDALGVWMRPADPEVVAWTGVANAPVLMHGDDLPRSGWADILMLLERLAPTPPVVPQDGDTRATMMGLCHEVFGEGGLMWNARLLSVHRAIESGGQQGYDLPVAQYLGHRYGYREGTAAAVHEALSGSIAVLDRALARGLKTGPYYFGAELTALDFYAAASLDAIAPLADADCPMHPKVRAGFEAMRVVTADLVTDAMLTHRDHMHHEHMPLPIQMK